MTEPTLLSTIAGQLIKLRGKVVYPGFPFFSVPIVVIWLIIIQFEGSLTLSPSAKISALHFESAVASGTGFSADTSSLVVVPKEVSNFLLPSNDGGFSRVRVSSPVRVLENNRNRIELTEQGLSVERGWVGVDYPLAFLTEEVLARTVLVEGQEKAKLLPLLELTTSDSVWIALGAVIGALFSFGLAAGLVKDGGQIAQQNPGGDV